jgi:hypothetical protein
MNITVKGTVSADRDPLGLSELAAPQPDAESMDKDWQAVSEALDAHSRRRRQLWTGSLASAASLVLVIALLAIQREDPATEPAQQELAVQTGTQEINTPAQEPSQGAAPLTTEELIGMSQTMERQLKLIRSQVGTMPSSMVVYQVELQDLIGQVDDALSLSPDSQELWGQRLELQMDLMKLYRNQLRRDYHRIASV